jgi:8-oxo-dGTP pyrophosphatase MutT (NUDIX family)
MKTIRVMKVCRTFTSSVFIVSSNRVLLHYHKRFNLILPFGGHLKNDESPHEAAIREIKEELGIIIDLFNTEKSCINYESARVKFLVSPSFTLCEKFNNNSENIDYIFFSKIDNLSGIIREDIIWCNKNELKDNNIAPDVFFLSNYALDIFNIK